MFKKHYFQKSIPQVNHESGMNLIKLEKRNSDLRKTILELNKLIGVQALSDSDESTCDVDDVDFNRPEVNTSYYQTDAFFAKKFYFITNVSISINSEGDNTFFHLMY